MRELEGVLEQIVWPPGTRSRAAVAALGGWVLLYVSWQLWRWTPGRQQYGQAFLPVVDAAALCATWVAARRCAEAPRLRSFWRWMGLAVAAQLVADALLLRNVVEHPTPPFPSPADPFFIAFYVLLLVALLRLPVAPVSGARRARLLIDGATIVIGGGALVWYFVLGPTALEGGESTLATVVSVAYPLGDLVLLAGLAVALLRRVPDAMRVPLLLIAAGMVCSIAADMVYGYGQLHGTYTNGDPVDTLYVLEFALFALAGFCQRPAGAGDVSMDVGGWRPASARGGWLPYAVAPAGLALLVAVDWRRPFFPELSLTLIVLLVGTLIAARQYLALREVTQAQAARREAETAKDEFLSVVGHELRTPLTSIRGALGLLEGGVMGGLPPEATQILSIAIANTDRLVRLIDDILDVERLSSGRIELAPRAVEAAELVGQAVRVVQTTATLAQVRIECDVAPLTVWADEDRVVQVLVNLLGNALKFSDRHSVVRVTVSAAEEGALFAIADEGRGIPPERLESVFERFRQVDASDAREKGGTGLGLPIARNIVEHHGARLWAQSTLGEGSTFRFTLALAPAIEIPGNGVRPAQPRAGALPAAAGAPTGEVEGA